RPVGQGASAARAARAEADRLRLLQPDDARGEHQGALRRVGLPARAGPASGHVPAHAAHRVGRASDEDLAVADLPGLAALERDRPRYLAETADRDLPLADVLDPVAEVVVRGERGRDRDLAGVDVHPGHAF